MTILVVFRLVRFSNLGFASQEDKGYMGRMIPVVVIESRPIIPAVTSIRYVSGAEVWDSYLPRLQAFLFPGCRALDVGGGAHPSVGSPFIAQHGIDYTLLDVSHSELEKAGSGYKTFCGDIADATLPSRLGLFDVIFSKMAAEHVRNGRDFHRNIFRLLKPGAVSLHFFPTLYNVPLVVNRLLPERLSWKLRKLVQPWTTVQGDADKFRAFYSWCRGPYSAQLRRLESIGFEVVEYVGSFGHMYYESIPGLRSLERITTAWLLRHPLPLFTVSAMVTLRKPESVPSRGAAPGY